MSFARLSWPLQEPQNLAYLNKKIIFFTKNGI